MANWSGIAATLSALVKPSILQPTLKVPSIASLDFARFRERGITGVVLDKDNCLTKPRSDELEASLQPAWDELLKTFGASNVLIVSNSAGTGKDSLLLQAESLSRNLFVPVLVHPQPKPGARCVRAVATHFLPASAELPKRAAVVWSEWARRRTLSSTIPSARMARPKLLIVGDRVTTDMILANRLNQLSFSSSPTSSVEAVSVLTTTLHAKEGLGTTLLRGLEAVAVWGLDRRRKNKGVAVGEEDWSDCLRESASAVVPASPPTPLPAPASTAPRLAFSRHPPFISFPSLSIPRLLASLHSPLARLTSLWTQRPLSRSPTAGWTPTSKWARVFSAEKGTVGAAERVIEEGEKLVQTARRRVLRS